MTLDLEMVGCSEAPTHPTLAVCLAKNSLEGPKNIFIVRVAP